MSVRPFVEADLDELRRLWRSRALEVVFEDLPISLDRWGPGIAIGPPTPAEPAAPPTEPSSALEMLVRSALTSEKVVVLVASEPSSDHLVGFALGSLSEHPVSSGIAGIVEHLFVEPNFRRRGIGTDLLQALESELDSRGCAVINVAVPPDESGPRRFLCARGWNPAHLVFARYY